MKKIDVLILIMLLGVVGAAQAQPTPVFEYSFPASYNGTGNTITDLSGAGNHATMDSSDRALIDNRPPGFDASLKSITGANGGHGVTTAIDLLDSASVAAAGGFRMDCWFQWEGTYTNIRKLIDYAGTEALRTLDGQIQFILSDGAYVLGMDIAANTWYHVVGVFDTQGNSPYPGAYGSDYDIDGVMSLYVDDVLIGIQAATKTGFGDSLNRPIGINRWAGGGADWYQGLNFNPSVYLGIHELPVRPVSPSNGDEYVSIDAEPTLQWLSGTNPNIVQHVLYFGTDENWVTNALPTDPAAIVLPVATETYQHPESLAYETDYFWRVDEATGDLSNPDNVETGPVWSFTTKSVPLPPCAGHRFDGDVDGDCYVDLNDLLILTGDWLEEGVGFAGDIDEDGKVNLLDYAFVGREWLVRDNPLMISEFMAVNSYVPFVSLLNIHTTVNGKPEYSDWIEIHNPDSQNSISLHGLYLTDNAENLTQWRFPDVSIAPGGYLVVWASRKTLEEHPDNYPFVDDEGKLHTNFQLSQNGEYLALVDVDGVTIISEFTPEFPEQRGHISYGTGSNGIENYLVTPTPGQSNSAAFTGVVSDTRFSVDRGFFETNETFDVAITTDTADALIRYTLDGSTPTLSNGNSYTTPIHIDSTTCLRAAAFKTDWLATDVDTQTYIFLDDVITQSPNGETPPGWPSSSVNGQVFDYGMDPDIVNHAVYGPEMLDAMKQISSISLVTDMDYLVGSTNGIYVNATLEGIMWERPVSAELINPDGTKGFQINAGLRIRGAFSRGDHNPKHSFRLLFKGGYGPGELRFPVFGNEGVDEFDNLDLRTAQNYAWSNTSSNPGFRNTFIRDVYSRDLQREMGRPYTRSRYYHLYLNGQYWGIYQSQERSEASYASSYFGGYDEYYDVIKTDNYRTSYTDGSLEKWNELWDLCDNGLETDAKYYALQGKDDNGNDDPSLPVHVDVDNLIDYMTDIFFAGNQDAPITLSGTAANNFYAIRDRRSEIRQGWVFFAYDSEHSMLSTGIDRTGWFSAGQEKGHFNPQWLHQKMMDHPEYRMRFADRVHKHFFNDGAMTTLNAVALLQQRASEIDLAIIGESARWGDQRPDRTDNPYTKAHWWNEVNGFLMNTFLSGRTQTVLNQLKNRDLYPNTDVPIFYINNSYQHGGHVEDNAVFSLTLSQSQTYDDKIYVDEYVPVRAHVPTDDSLGLTWTETSFTPDSTWTNGTTDTGVGYENGSGYENWIHTDVDAEMYNISTSVYCRIEFENDGLQTPELLELHMKYDDGFIAYLNGGVVELTRSNNINNEIPGSASAGNHEASQAYDIFDVTDKRARLQTGTNVLAIHGINISQTSTDMIVLPKLIGKVPAGEIPPEGVWYTINGEDPRLPGGSINPNAAEYTNSFALTESTVIKARTFHNSEWSAMNEAVYAVGPVAKNLRITELMYHPAGDPNAEFIEVMNIHPTDAISLALVRLTNGVEFEFPPLTLGAGERAVVVKDLAAFEMRYGTGINVVPGEYSGSLSNGGEEIDLKDAIGAEIHDFDYNDGWYEITDGLGFSLTIRDPYNTDPNDWDEKDGWRASFANGGSPGEDDSGFVLDDDAVIINEVLAHSDTEPSDWIEFYNTTEGPIDIGGWFISDDGTDLMKYEIEDNYILPSHGYAVFYADPNFRPGSTDPGSHTGFALSENGEKVYLTSGSGGALTGVYSTERRFYASEPDVAFGHYVKSTGTDFVAMSSNTPGVENAYPKVGPVVINEIAYNPESNGDAEFVEFLNVSGGPVTLYDLVKSAPWRFVDDWEDATPSLEYFFPAQPSAITLADGEYFLLVKDKASFETVFLGGGDISTLGVQWDEWTDGSLNNGGEQPELQKPGDPGYYIRVDRVKYSDGSHPVGDDLWPTKPDDSDTYTLQRRVATEYGNDVINWDWDPYPTATPGTANPSP